MSLAAPEAMYWVIKDVIELAGDVYGRMVVAREGMTRMTRAVGR